MSSAHRRLARNAALLLVLAAGTAQAAAPSYTNSLSAVTLDGVRLGQDTNASALAAIVSVVYDAPASTFHLWVDAAATNTLAGIRHATSTDGVHFTSTGSLTYAAPPNFAAYGATGEPTVEFPRVARLGATWKLLLWTENVGASAGAYNYNESANDLGASLGSHSVVHRGPVYPTGGAGTAGQTTGPSGLVGGSLFVQDDRVGGLSRWTYADATPPSVATPPTAQKDLITGTGFVYGLTNPGNPLGVYVHNVSRLLDQGDGTLGVFYSLRFYPSGARVNKQIYYAESADGGATWSAPAGIFANGALVTVDGGLNTFEFSHPEVALAGAQRILYFSTRAADGRLVVATSAAQAGLGTFAVPSLAPAALALLALALAGAGMRLSWRG